MKRESVAVWVKYLICFGVACLITFGVIAFQGFFTDDAGVNVQILADGFCVAGIVLTFTAGLLFASSEGIFLGAGYIFRNFILAWVIPGGRAKQEMYGEYRERQVAKLKKFNDFAILFVGLLFLAVGIVLTLVWYAKFYNVVS